MTRAPETAIGMLAVLAFATAGLIMFFFALDHWLLWEFPFFTSNSNTSSGTIVACVPPIEMAFLGLSSPAAAIVLAHVKGGAGWAVLLSEVAPVA